MSAPAAHDLGPIDPRDSIDPIGPTDPIGPIGLIDPLDPAELRQHEIAGSLHRFDLDRRGFVKLLGGGVLVCLTVPALGAQESGRAGDSAGSDRRGHELPQELSAWLHIDPDGRVTVFCGKVEMGQAIRTSLAQQVAEELRVSLETIHMVLGDTDLTPWDAGTFGSRSTPTMGPRLRAAAASAREVLMAAAAEHWQVARGGLIAEGGRVTNPASGQAVGYGELARAADMVKVLGIFGGGEQLTPARDWKIAGTSAPRVGGRELVTGKHQYTSDLALPGMLHGKVLRPAGFKATLAALDSGPAERLPGVKVVRDGDFVGLVAPDAWLAQRALAAIKAEWKVPPQPADRDLFEQLRKGEPAGEGGESRGHVAGSVEKALEAAEVKLPPTTYTVAYIAHAPLEPRAAVAEWSGDRLTVWTGTQRPFAVRDELAEALHIPSGRVRVIVPDTGSAYGGKHTGEAAVEAARLAKAAGKPVKLVWTREEEFTWSYFRPAGVITVRSGARRDGRVVAWEFDNFNSGPAAIATPYEIENQRVQFHPAQAPLRQGSYRGLAATANHFARESHMDELANALGLDPLQFRLKNLAEPRLRAVLEAAASKFGWSGRRTGAGVGSGIAGGTEKGGYVATCAAVEIEPGTRRVRIRRVVTAFECGAVVNPNGLRNQIEGALVQGIGGALFEAVRFDNGRILNPHFAKYRVPRFTDLPDIEVVILDRRDLPSAGAGETPIVGLAPAVGNAIFAATGSRLRGLPLAPGGLPASDRAPRVQAPLPLSS